MYNRLKNAGWGIAFALLAFIAVAPTQSARNGSGTYTVPNTFVSGQPITASSHNGNWTDIAAEITNSIAADGQTTITGALKGANGTVSLPAYSFASDLDTGLYRIGANNLGIAANGAKVLDIATTGLGVTGTLASTGNLAINTDKFTVNATSGNAVIGGSLSLTSHLNINTNKFSVLADSGNTTVAGTLGVTGATTLSSTLAVTGAATLSSSISAASVTGSMVATQAQMETATSNTVVATPGRVQYHPGVAKAWAKFSVAGVVAAGHNVASVTDTGTGNWTVNYTTACSSADYVALITPLGTSSMRGNVPFVASQATGSVTINVVDNGAGAAIETGITAMLVAVYCDQ
jgi:hypothetical protein